MITDVRITSIVHSRHKSYTNRCATDTNTERINSHQNHTDNNNASTTGIDTNTATTNSARRLTPLWSTTVNLAVGQRGLTAAPPVTSGKCSHTNDLLN